VPSPLLAFADLLSSATSLHGEEDSTKVSMMDAFGLASLRRRPETRSRTRIPTTRQARLSHRKFEITFEPTPRGDSKGWSMTVIWSHSLRERIPALQFDTREDAQSWIECHSAEWLRTELALDRNGTADDQADLPIGA
jgi:hypothetical protein